MAKMPNSTEVIERLARENEQLKLLAMISEVKDLDELKVKLKSLTATA